MFNSKVFLGGYVVVVLLALWVVFYGMGMYLDFVTDDSSSPISSVDEAHSVSVAYVDFIRLRPELIEQQKYERAILDRVEHYKTSVEVVYKMISILKIPRRLEADSPYQREIDALSKVEPTREMKVANVFAASLVGVCISLKLGKDEHSRRIADNDYRCYYGE